jgi:16S rRNA (guanine527-N7)-methyltransferase
MLGEAEVRRLLAPFGLELASERLQQLVVYLDLLLRWNKRINLTAIRSPEECVTRHFGESLYLMHWVELKGSLLDIGSGAGFPGLALKLAASGLREVLLEPVAKKRAFLKEVIRACGIEGVEVRGERLEDFALTSAAGGFDTVTWRAVGRLDELLPLAVRVLRLGGQLCLWLGMDRWRALAGARLPISWLEPIPVPQSRSRVIVIGTRRAVTSGE